jgi:hypothetical protein
MRWRWFALLFVISTPLLAEDGQQSGVVPSNTETGYWSIQYENDLFGGSDRYYTQGIEISYARAGYPPAWLSPLMAMLPTYESSRRAGVTYSLGHKIFTPADITATALIPDDRPYAGYLYTAVTYTNSVEIKPDLQHVNVAELTLGLVGPSAGGEFLQNTIHSLIGTPLAYGWDNQLNNEVTLGISYFHKWRLFEPDIAGQELEISPYSGFTLGNAYTYVAGGVMFRWGKGLRRDMGPPNIRPGFIGSTYFVPDFEPNWYFFLGHETRLVYRNIFLDGNTFSDSHSVYRELIVGDIQFGFAIHRKRYRFAISNIFRSKEFTTQGSYTQYGSLNLTYYL